MSAGHSRTLRRARSWHGIQTWGYRPERAITDISLALVGGTESVLWGCTYAAMIFSGPLSGHLPIAIVVFLLSTALILAIVALSSHLPLHLTAVDEQAVAVVATIAIAAGARWDQFASPAAAAATIFVIMASISLLTGLALHLAARFNIEPLIQLVPFPVVCGFLGGLGWLLFGAAVTMLTGVGPIVSEVAALLQFDALSRWMPALLGGIGIFVLLHVKDHFLVLPGILLAGVVVFYLVAYWSGATLDSLRQDDWVFRFEAAGDGVKIDWLDFVNVNFAFIGSVLPELATIVALCLLSSSFNLSALEVVARKPLPLKSELRTLGTANIASGMVMGLPGNSDIVGSVTFRKVGATSRAFTLIDGAVCVIAAIGAGSFIEYVPKIVIAAVVFYTAIQMMHDWMFIACRKMILPEALAVWSIFVVIVAAGFMPGVILGIVLMSLLFIVRYSRIDVVDSSFFLHQLASSIDRPANDLNLLNHYGGKAKIFNLRGFLFFGTASLFYETLKRLFEEEGGYEYVILNFHRVTGMDSTAVQVFSKIIGFLQSMGTLVVFCGMKPSIRRALAQIEHFGQNRLLIRDDLDTALKWVEEHLLVTHEPAPGPKNIHDIVEGIINDRAKADWLVKSMERLEIGAGDYLFRMGENDTSLYIIESGMIEVRLESSGRITRLRDFSEGTVIGEMAAYSDQKVRTASAVAIVPSVVYRLAQEKVIAAAKTGLADLSILHEFVARLVVARLIFMNKRLQLDL